MISALNNIFYNLQNYQQIDNKVVIASKAKKRIVYRVFLFLPTIIKLQKLYEKYNLDFVLQRDINHYNKAYYPFLNKNVNNRSKLKYLEAHFQTISRFKPAYQHLLYTQSITLLDMSKYGIDLILKVEYDHFSRHEGELTIFLEEIDKHNKIFKITGLFGENTFYIGGVQGQTDKDTIRNLTKTLFGMRPHNFLLYCLMQFVSCFGCEEIYGVKNAYHISNSRQRTRGLISFNYDGFWQELSPIKETTMWYILSADYKLRDLLEIKRNKRSMYKKRYSLLANISDDIQSKSHEFI